MADRGNTDSPFAECTELVIVCCHATYIGNGSSIVEDQWLLQDFQKANVAAGKASETETFVMHIRAGAQICESHPHALLMFSGGRTTKSERTEAQSYAAVLLRLRHGPLKMDGAYHRHAREDHATDSFQNLLFSILRFHTLTGRYPANVTVITHAFKERRFLELHAAAIKWPQDRIRVQGINPPFTLKELEETQKGERQRAFELFREDPYGVRPRLADKRMARNWSPDHVAGLTEDETVKALLQWTGGESGREVFPDKLPWEEG